VLAHGHGQDGGGEVSVVRGANGDSVDILTHFFEHDAEVLELFGVWETLEILFNATTSEIHVTPCRNFRFSATADSGNDSIGTSATSNHSEVDPLAWWQLPILVRLSGDEVRRQHGKTKGSCGFLEEGATLDVIHILLVNNS